MINYGWLHGNIRIQNKELYSNWFTNTFNLVAAGSIIFTLSFVYFKRNEGNESLTS